MYTKEDILEMLQNGQEAEDLAQGFIDSLNAAIKEKEELDLKAAEAEKAAKRVQKEKVEIIDGIIDVIFGFIEEYYPKVYSETMHKEITATEVVDAMDEAYEEICGFTNALDDFAKILEKAVEDKDIKIEKKVVTKPEEKGENVDFSDLLDPIEQFLKENHLI